LVLLVMFGYRDPAHALIWPVAITLSLLVHEFGHALVARHLRHSPSITLHGMGGLTSRTRTGRDVEEATIIAMGPAAGLALGLVIFGLWQLPVNLRVATPFAESAVRILLYPCITWNLLNLIPLWPLDGGQLFRLGAGRWLSPQRAARVTHILSLVVVAALAIPAYRAGMTFSLFLLAWLAIPNFQALQGKSTGEGAPAAPVAVASSLTTELVDNAFAAYDQAQYKDAARLAHQARAQDGISPSTMERIWEVLGLATARLDEPEEALSYLRRARPSERVREATQACLSALGRDEELEEIRGRWAVTSTASTNMRGWLVGTLSFIVVAISMVFGTSLSEFFF
jgi:stage IV sporulation protein FB